MRMHLQDRRRTGLLPEHRGMRIGQGEHRDVRLTEPAREALAAAGARISPTSSQDGLRLYSVGLGATVPRGIVAVHIIGTSHTGLRTDSEPEYPGEVEAYWSQLDFMPCPRCTAPLVWYEAGYVPGYRVCAGPKHHHVQAMAGDES